MSLISVIMPVYNAENFISQAIESVLSQTYTDFEFLIYDDGCSDNSIEIVKSINDKRIKIFSDGKNKGIVPRLNFLIKQSKGKYIARIDADDVWYSEKLEKQIVFLDKNNEFDMLASLARLIDNENKEIKSVFSVISEYDEIKKELPKNNFIIHSSVVFRKSVFEKIGLYRDKYLHAEDYDLWFRFIENNIKFKILPEILLDYRISLESVNSKFRKTQNENVIKLKLQFYKKYGFKLYYLSELLRNYYYWCFPYWILILKRKTFNKCQVLRKF